MKNLNFKATLISFVVAFVIAFAFTACNSGSGEAANDSVEEVAACTDDCLKACCLGCKATVGDVVCLANHSCCATHEHEGEADSLEVEGLSDSIYNVLHPDGAFPNSIE